MEETYHLGTLKEEDEVASDLLKEKLQIKEKFTKPSADGNLGTRGKETARTKDSLSTASGLDDPGHVEDTSIRFVEVENTYQLAPYKRFPVDAATDILKDILTSYLQEEKYEAERARELSLTLCSVIKERMKELKVPRYKLVVQVHIGQLNNHSLEIASRCLWDQSVDTFATYSFKNSSQFGVGTVYAVYLN